MSSVILAIPFVFLAILGKCDSVQNVLKDENLNSDENGEIPLFLTKYIENGDIELAQKLSRVGDLPNDAPPLESYSGFITVNKEYNSNIFFWFFPAVNKDPKAPVLLWLQGGPGNSGLLGLFVEHGPYMILSNLTAVLREYHWARIFHVIYVDSPVGTGYSFTENMKGYANSQSEMADDMYEFLRQFFILFSEYKMNDFYIAGQSYGGKWVPSLAHRIHSMGSSAVIQLTGIMIGNGFCDPETVITSYSEFMYNIGHIDEIQAEVIKSISDNVVKEIKKENFDEARDDMGEVLYLYRKFSGMKSIYNFLIVSEPEDYTHYIEYIALPKFKEALKVGDVAHSRLNFFVRMNLAADIMKSVKPNITVIMDHYKVLVYHGQLDVIIPYTAIFNFLKSLKWKFADEYKTAERERWYLKNSTEIAGYVHNVGDFYEVMVRNAGHFAPSDKPEVVFDLISRFVNNESYY